MPSLSPRGNDEGDDDDDDDDNDVDDDDNNEVQVIGTGKRCGTRSALQNSELYKQEEEDDNDDNDKD
jgi:hypothetical protein